MMIAAQARAISKQKNYNYLVELQCKKIDERIRDMVAHHGDTLYQPVEGCVIEDVMKMLEMAGYKVTRLVDAWHNPSNDLKIEWGE